jgi:hypothetical protein
MHEQHWPNLMFTWSIYQGNLPTKVNLSCYLCNVDDQNWSKFNGDRKEILYLL